MKTHVSVKYFVLALVAPLLTVATTINRVEGDAGKKARPPNEECSLTALPYLGVGYNSRPVVVLGVTADKKELTVNQVRLFNISSKPASAIRLGWYLRTMQGESAVLRQGETPLIATTGKLPTNGKQAMNIAVVSFTELLKDGQLNGAYKVEVAVKEVLFEDGSTWTDNVEQGRKTVPVRVAFKISTGFTPLKVTPLAAQFCPADKTGACVYVSDPPFSYWICDAGPMGVWCNSCGLACCTSLCEEPAPECGPCN